MVDLTKLMSGVSCIVGTVGSGKTYLAKYVIEYLLEQSLRTIIIDPTGVYYGLRSGADGKSEGGFPILVFGGEHADIEIDENSGDKIAETLANRDVKAIIDISEFTGGEKTRFLTAFLQKLYARNNGALHLIVDEADEVCPQQPMPDERRLLGAFDKIVRRGRVKGFRPMMITQRPAVLHKNVMSQISTLIAMKLVSPQDRKAVEDWVKGNADADQAKEVLKSLPTLARGEGWVWSPADEVLERMKFPKIRTFDSSRTPEYGEDVFEPELSSVEIEALKEALHPEQEEEPVAADKGASATPIVRGYTEQQMNEAKAAAYEMGMREGIHRRDEEVRAWMNQFPEPNTVSPANEKYVASSNGRTPDLDSDNAGSIPAAATTDLSPSAEKLIDQIFAVYPRSLSLAAAAKRAGLSSRSSAYRRNLKQARESGLLKNVDGDHWKAAHKPAGYVAPAGIEDWYSKVTPSCASILKSLREVGQPLPKPTIAEMAGISPTSSGLGSSLRELVQLGLIEPNGDRYRLHPDFL